MEFQFKLQEGHVEMSLSDDKLPNELKGYHRRKQNIVHVENHPTNMYRSEVSAMFTPCKQEMTFTHSGHALPVPLCQNAFFLPMGFEDEFVIIPLDSQ